jgi:HemY protein
VLRAAGYIVLAALVLALAWVLGGLPGSVTAQVGAYTVTTSTPAAAVLIFGAALLTVILLRVCGALGRTPGHFSTWRGNRRARLGEVATQRALVALRAGDAKAASSEAGRAKKLLGETPLVLLVIAESARLAGRTDEAAAAFTALSAHKEMGFLGHHGLARASLDAHDHAAARTHALAAEAAYPNAPATAAQHREIALREKNFAGALALTTDKAESAALAIAAAQDAAPAQAVTLAQKAVKAAPGFAPAIAALAHALRAAGQTSAARKTLLKAWKAAPHPLLAREYLADAPTALARAQAAQDLAAAHPGHVESELVLAETAQEAGLPAEANRHAIAAKAKGDASGRAVALLEGKPAPAARWTCAACHATTPDWSALCPACGKPGTLH